MEISTAKDDTNKCYSITGLNGYSYSDIQLKDWKEEVDGIACAYLLRDKTGLRTYFNEDGVVVLQKDAHNNTIIYTYTDKIYLKKITDSVGRKIRFHYEDTDEGKILQSVSVKGKASEGGVSQKKVTYEVEERTYTPLNSDTITGLVLKSATVDGEKETYGYRTVDRILSTCGGGIASQRAATNESYLLNKVTCDGAVMHYEYRTYVARGLRTSQEQKRDVAVLGYYVTREYQEEEKTKKKTEGIKYDFFQQQGEKLIRFCDFNDETEQVYNYGTGELRTTLLTSSFNPNSYKNNGAMSDYTYKKSAIDTTTLTLKKNTKKNVSAYIYNNRKLLMDEVDYGKEKEEILYEYDNSLTGSLVVLMTSKSYDTKGKEAISSKQGYTYDSYRNIISQKKPGAYLAKNEGNESLFTTTYTYQGTEQGYPAEDVPFSRCILLTSEEFISGKTKCKMNGTLAKNGIDYASISEQRSVDGGAYQTCSMTDFFYDEQGNEICGISYPSYSRDEKKESIQYDYTYNSLGQQTKTEVTITSARYPEQNQTYTQETITYDSFGNELSYKNEKGVITRTTYEEETGENLECVTTAGTGQETSSREYRSADTLKRMTVDEAGRVSIAIEDSFGNTIVSKDEKGGTWTESTYDYGEENQEEEEEEEDSGENVQARLIEERTYFFLPDERKFIINEAGEETANYYISGKGNEVLSGIRYFYDDLGDEIGSASFGGDLDAEHCTEWSFTKEHREVEEDCIITTNYSKQLDPSAYRTDVDADNYYEQFNEYVLTETITTTVTDEAGNTVSESSTVKRGEGILKSDTDYTYDDFGNTITKHTITKKYQNKQWLPAYETEDSYEYDANGNVVQTETKNRKEGESVWQTQVTKSNYDDQGKVTEEYSPQGVEEGYCTKYEYDILGQLIKTKIPQCSEDGSIVYQTITNTYDTAGNLTEKEEQIDKKRTARTEYTYDKLGRLTMVKSHLENKKAQYVQYVYDREGNKVRQFTGMSAPLTLTIAEGEGEDNYSCGGTNYHIKVSGKKKADKLCETKYEYDKKGNLTALTDAEGRTETYCYDDNGNQTETIDKNGNTIRNTYDFQNRLTKTEAKDKETEETTTHTYRYNSYGEVAQQDGTDFTYSDVSGHITKETMELDNGKTVVREYTYDSGNNRTHFAVAVGEDTVLSLDYAYDGSGRLTDVIDEEGSTIASYAYNTQGNCLKKTVSAIGLDTSYCYDYNSHLTGLQNAIESGTVTSYTCSYLHNGQKAEETGTITDEEGKSEKKTATYTYDLLGRITKETKTGEKAISYTYDSNNNRKETKIGDKTTSYVYNKNDELQRTDTLNIKTEENAAVIYKNDKNGNQLATVYRKQVPDTCDPYLDVDVSLGDNRLNENVVNHYNALNQLTDTLTKDSKVSYTYDAEGLRSSKTVNGEKTIYVWDSDQLVLELSKSGKVKKRYIRGNDLIYADGGEETEKTYYAMNPHGDVVQLLDENGSVTKTYEYDSFGKETEEDSKDDNPFRYCGEYYDKETGEIYLRARYYQPSAGRFLTRDTYTGEQEDPLSLHLYAYCGYDGVNRVDPSGHFVMAIPMVVKVMFDFSATVVVSAMAYDTVTDISDNIKREKLREKVNTTTITLPDVKEKRDNSKRYRLATITNKNKLDRFGAKMNFSQALASLGITSASNKYTRRVALTEKNS